MKHSKKSTPEQKLQKIINTGSKTKSGYYLAEVALMMKKPEQKMMDALIEAGEALDVDMNSITRTMISLSNKKDYDNLDKRLNAWITVIDILMVEEKENLKFIRDK
jgi:hypothetical protein